MMNLTIFLLAILQSFAQQATPAKGVTRTELPVVYLPPDITVHIVSPEPITYADVSVKQIAANIPLKNVLRIKSLPDSLNRDAVLTITGEKFMAQYHLVRSLPSGVSPQTRIEILPRDMQPVVIPGIGLSHPEMKRYATEILLNKPGRLANAKAYGMQVCLNGIYSLDDYLFLDVGLENRSNLKFDMDELRFTVEDKKIVKATNVQAFELKPEYVLTDRGSIYKYYRNVYVFRKFTFPGNKVLHIQLSEKQVSGRVVDLSIKYQQVLDAEMLNPE